MLLITQVSADTSLHRVPVGKEYMCAGMKQLVARAKAGPATRAVGTVIEAVIGVVTGAVTQHQGQKRK